MPDQLHLIDFASTRAPGGHPLDQRIQPGGPIRVGDSILVGVVPDERDPLWPNSPNYGFAEMTVVLWQPPYICGLIGYANRDIFGPDHLRVGSTLICEWKHIYSISEGELADPMYPLNTLAELDTENALLNERVIDLQQTNQRLRARTEPTAPPSPN